MHYFYDEPRFFADKLTKWYHEHSRSLPWRNTKDPYKIWLSEIILQQTRVLQGLNYYLKFVKHYPTVTDLANSTEESILKDWQGLGYYSRARNLHSAAKFICADYNGVFPTTYNEILELKGVGEYTAAAISSFSFDLPYAVVDGNVYRLLSRIFGIDTPIDSTAGKKEFKTLANHLLNKKNPATYNQTIMEFGALQCTPKNPYCECCPFQKNCVAFKTNKIDSLPFKAKKTKQRNRFLNYLIFEFDNKTIVNQRKGKGIWQNLFDFPMIETTNTISSEKMLSSIEYKEIIGDVPYELSAESSYRKHILSHQILQAKFYHIKITQPIDVKHHDYRIVNKNELLKLAIPKLIENYLNEETNLLSLFN